MSRVKNFAQLAVHIMLLFIACSVAFAKEQATQHTQQLPVQTYTVATSKIPIYLDYIGTTKAIYEVTLRARVSGFLIKKNFREGSIVKKGQLLYVIDPSQYKAQLKQAIGNLELSVAQEIYLKAEYLRMKALVAKGAISKEKFDQAEANYREGKAKVKIDAAKVEVAKLNLSYCYVHSPITGRTGQTLIDVGNYISAQGDNELAKVTTLNPIYVIFSPSISDFSEIVKYRKNAPFKVVARLPHLNNFEMPGKTDLVDNIADQKTSTVLMRAVIKNPGQLLISGIYVNLRMFIGENPNAILIPTSAIMSSQAKQSVYVLDKNNKVSVRYIKSDQEYKKQSVVSSGLQIGDVVVVSNIQKIRPGQTVRPVAESKIKAPKQ